MTLPPDQPFGCRQARLVRPGLGGQPRPAMRAISSHRGTQRTCGGAPGLAAELGDWNGRSSSE